MIENKINYIALVLLISLFSCEKDIEIEVEEGVNKMVLNAWLEEGEIPELKIYNSVFIFDQKKSGVIGDASVNLFSKGNLVGELVYDGDKKLYTNRDVLIAENTNYEVVVEQSKYGTVSSSVDMPRDLSSEEVELKYVNFLTEENQYQNYAGEVQVSIKDPAGERNYYLIRVKSLEENWNAYDDADTVYTYHYWNSFNTNDNQIQLIYQPGGGDLMLLSDEIFNGGTYSFALSSYNDLRKYEYAQDSTSYTKRYHQIQLYLVNEAFYRYYVSLENNRYPDVFTEPTQVYSNIENGYGIIGASTKHLKDIEETYSFD